jgi:hypothetical protein
MEGGEKANLNITEHGKIKIIEHDVIKIYPESFWAGGMYRTASERRVVEREREYYI